MIRKAVPGDLDGVEQGYTELLTHEQESGAFTKWRLGIYPTRETAEKSLDCGTLYVLEQNGGIDASMILDQLQPAEYGKIIWKYPAGPQEVLIIHTLCVRPSKSGRGIGKQMVRYAIEEARRLGCRGLRLDTGVQNKPAVSLYTGLGFELAGTASILLDGTIPHEGHLFFELKIPK